MPPYAGFYLQYTGKAHNNKRVFSQDFQKDVSNGWFWGFAGKGRLIFTGRQPESGAAGNRGQRRQICFQLSPPAGWRIVAELSGTGTAYFTRISQTHTQVLSPPLRQKAARARSGASFVRVE